MSEELHTLAGLYVVDALDDDERARFDAHLADCAACQEALLLGIGWIGSHRALDRQEAISAVLTAPDAKSVDLGGEGTMRVVYSPSLDRSVVVADGLADLPSDSTYALWFIGPGGPEEAALFRTSGGRATKVLPRTPEGYQALGVTKEPAGGSDTPTEPILLQGEVVPA